MRCQTRAGTSQLIGKTGRPSGEGFPSTATGHRHNGMVEAPVPYGPLDTVVAAKLSHHKPLCAKEGWTARVCAADVFGFFHPETIPVIASLAKRVATKAPLGDPKLDHKAVWSAVSAAAISRAASKLLRHSTLSSSGDDGDDDEVPGNPSSMPDQSFCLPEAPVFPESCNVELDKAPEPDNGFDIPVQHTSQSVNRTGMEEDAVALDAPLLYTHNPYSIPSLRLDLENTPATQPSVSQMVAVASLRQRMRHWNSGNK